MLRLAPKNSGLWRFSALISELITSSTDIFIRPAEPADTPLILQLIRELAEYEQLAHKVTATEEQLAESLFSKGDARVQLAFLGLDPAGFAAYFFSFSTFRSKRLLYVEDLFVRAPFRRQGVGRAIFKRLTDIATEERCSGMNWSVLDWNEPAIGFYDDLGAEAEPQWIRYRFPAKELLP